MDHHDVTLPDDADRWALELECIPGIEPPNREGLRALDPGAPAGTSDAIIIHNGSQVWNYYVRELVKKYPLLGVAGSAANRTFTELFDLHHLLRAEVGCINALYTLADFVMICPLSGPAQYQG